MNIKQQADDGRPNVVEQIVRVVGEEGAIAIMKSIGGQKVRIPSTEVSQVFRDLAAVVGEEKARALCKELGRVDVYIPKRASAERAIRNAKIRQRFDELSKEMSANRSVALLVSEFSLSDRQISFIVNT